MAPTHKRKRADSQSAMEASDASADRAAGHSPRGPHSSRRLRRGRAGEELDAVRHGAPLATALKLVGSLLKEPGADSFAHPVLEMWTEEEVPGYAELVPHPMDLGTVQRNARALEYVVESGGALDFDDESFVNDVRRVFRNCMNYNDPKSDFYRLARRLLARVDRSFKPRAVVVSLKDEGRQEEDRAVESEDHFDSGRRNEKRRRGDRSARRSSTAEPPVKNKVTARAAAAAEAAARAVEAREEAVRAATDKAAKASAAGAARAAARKAEQAEAARVEEAAAAAAAAAPKVKGRAKAKPQKSAPAPKPQKPRPDSATNMAPPPAGGGAAAHSAAAGPAAAAGANGSSVSSDELERGADVDGVMFLFVSTNKMQRRRGRKSAVVQDLENRHDVLTRRRKVLLESRAALESNTKIPMSVMEKALLCDKVAVLDFVRMGAVVDIIANGMNRHDILDKPEVDFPIDSLSNGVLRRIQAYLEAPAVVASHGTLKVVDREIAEIESQIVGIRYVPVGA